jgi:hypothetical protein
MGRLPVVDRRDRHAILSQGATKAETPKERREREALELDLEGSPNRGRPIRSRLRNFRPGEGTYLAALGGPLPWMRRLRQIEDALDQHERRLEEAWRELAGGLAGDPERFAEQWAAVAAGWSFDEVNDLIERHNRNFPAEARLPMDPRTRDFVLVNGKPYRREPVGPAWILERFPPERAA